MATDHRQLIVLTLKRVAEKYGMACITHEKPFAGVNGSGKHVNFSFGSPTLGNLLEPGDTRDNAPLPGLLPRQSFGAVPLNMPSCCVL
ncbi:MAG: hypothetical protein R3D55_25435 [Chloroflexota bacterium]